MGVVYVAVCVSQHLKEELAWDTYKQLWIISNIMLFKAVIPLSKLKNGTILSLHNIVCIAMWSLVTYSNCFVIYCRCCMVPPLRYVSV